MNLDGGADRLRPITVRFSRGTYDIISDMVYDSYISKVELVRMTVDRDLGRYLGTVRLLAPLRQRR